MSVDLYEHYMDALRRGHRVTAVDTAGGRLVELDAKRGIGSEPPTTALVPEGDAVRAVEKLGAQAFGDGGRR